MRTRIFALILIIFLLILLVGLVYIQIGMHERYRVLSEENRLKIVPLMAPRGSIFDRNGEVLVKDVLSFNACVLYNKIKDVDSLINILSSVLEVPKEAIRENIKKSKKQPYSLTCIALDIGIERAIPLEEVAMDYPGLLLEVSAKREYVHGKTASNILGYLGYINRSEFEKLKHYGYKINDLVGRDGIEKYYDDYLRGTHGGKQVEVDHFGREVSTMGLKEPSTGRDVYLTIDLELQEFCDGLLEEKRGAIIVMDSDTGAVLAMANAPSYDPAIFIESERRPEVAVVLKDKNYPLLNRAIAGAYPPGSVFKVVTATAALEAGVVNEATSFNCIGHYTLGKIIFRCWRKGGHGIQMMNDGIKNSCNVYFFNLGRLLGVDKLSKFAEKFGLGARTGIDLPGEKSGLVPTPRWKRKRFNENWYKGDTLNYSIGQGYLLCSPLQIVRVMSVFANGGYLVKPYLVSKVGGVPLETVEKTDLEISDSSFQAVRKGLRSVVNDPRATGMKAKLSDVIVAGKTGTAQTSRGKNHGWFSGFAPYENSKITVVVFDEYGGRGGYYAAATAGKIFKKAKETGLLDSE